MRKVAISGDGNIKRLHIRDAATGALINGVIGIQITFEEDKAIDCHLRIRQPQGLTASETERQQELKHLIKVQGEMGDEGSSELDELTQELSELEVAAEQPQAFTEKVEVVELSLYK